MEGFPVGDGSWHTVTVARQGFNFFTSVDDGEGWRRNESIASLAAGSSGGAEGEGGGWDAARFSASRSSTPAPVVVERVVVGGMAENVDANMVSVEEDLSESKWSGMP